jgi:nitrate reductase gamma subunit
MDDIILLLIGVIMPYIALLIFILGLFYRLMKWLSSPVPIRMPLTPAPISRLGVIGRMSTEFLIFRSLSKANKKLWLGSWLFHILLGTTLIVHLINIYLYENFTNIINSAWYDLSVAFSGILFGGMVTFLLFRRVFTNTVRHVSRLPDYLILLLLFVIIFLGNYTRSYSGVSLNDVRTYMYSLLIFHPTLPPNNTIFLLHYFMAQILLIYIPFSKVAHLIGWILAPSRNMRNIARFKRHINPWNDKVPGIIEPWEKYYERYKQELEQLGPEGERK